MEESFELGKGCFGLDQCQARLYTAILRHLVLVMAALAVCAVTAAQLRERTDTQAPPPGRPGRQAARRPRADPAHRPRDQAPARRRTQPPAAARPRRPLAPLATPPPGTITLVPPTRTPGTQLRPGQLAIGDCRTRCSLGPATGDGCAAAARSMPRSRIPRWASPVHRTPYPGALRYLPPDGADHAHRHGRDSIIRRPVI